MSLPELLENLPDGEYPVIKIVKVRLREFIRMEK